MLQVSYIIATSDSFDAMSSYIIPITSLAFTVLSIILAVIQLYWHKLMLFDQDLIMIEFDVCGPSVHSKAEKVKNIVHSLCWKMARILSVGKGMVEIMRPTDIPKGLRVHVNVSVVIDDEKDENLCEKFETLMNDAINSGLVQATFGECWKLDQVPTVSNLSVSTKDSKKRIKKWSTMEGVHMTMEEEKEADAGALQRNENEIGDDDIDVDFIETDMLQNDEGVMMTNEGADNGIEEEALQP